MYTSPVWGSPKYGICFSWSHLDEIEEMRLNNSGNFRVGQVPRTSHVMTRPKKHVSDASVPRCHGLLQQAPPPVCSWLVVEGILHVYTRYLDARTCSWTTLYVIFPFGAGSSEQTILEDCLLLLAAAAVFLLFHYFSRFFLRQSVCEGPHEGGCTSNW